MRNNHTTALNLMILTILLFLGSCCVPCRQAAPKVGTLEEYSFRLIELNTQPVEQEVVTVRFSAEEKMFYGSAPCNNFFGSYHLYEAKGTERNIEFSNVGATRKMCPDVDMSIEEDFAALLSRVKRVMFEGDNLVLVDTNESRVAVLERESLD